jgi:hypothetical protein
VQLCAQGLRAQAELGGDAGELLSAARRAALQAAPVTPNAAGWLALAECEAARARGAARPGAWADAAGRWERVERLALAAYCRWRQAEALVAAGADATAVLAAAASPAASRPLLRELERVAA